MHTITHKLNRTLLFYVFIFSTFVTMLATSLQLYLDYKKDIEYLDTLSTQISKSHVKGLSTAAWNMDVLQIQVLLDGLVAIPEVTYASVLFQGEKISESGNENNKNTIKHKRNLKYERRNEIIHIGEFDFHISKDHAIQSLINQFFVVLFINFIRTFLVAGFILFVVDFLITKHLVNITQSLKKIESFELLDNEIVLEGNRSKRNELDVVVSSINELLKNLKELWESYRISENNFFQLVDHSSQGILISTDGKIDFCNKQFLRMFDIKSLQDIDYEQFSPYFINYGKEIYNVDIQTLNKKNEEYRKVRNEIHLKDTNQDFLFYTSAAIWNNKFGTLLMFVDITEAVELKKRLKQQQAKLIQKDKMNTLGVMVTGITHEVNNPNNLIKINAEVIQNSWNEVLPILDEYYAKHPDQELQNIPYDEMRGLLTAAMEDTASASKRIEKIISGLSTFIRGEETLEMSKCELPKIIVETIKMLQPQIKKRRVHIVFDNSVELPAFEANSSLINQVFVNLILNAVEACDPRNFQNDQQGEVKIETSVTEDYVYVIIKDNGIGIKEKDINKVFDLFQSSKSTIGGTGIGLSIVYALIKLHHGEIWVESEEGFGSTFTVKLPIKQGKSESKDNKEGISLG
ncbi:ATP-binding protein [Cocleimonas sp. KMM 6892]|uniref:ATP-binding protein n=1 Tax=unclassified Cocleimonas TaxID=2639732 RepID=UPI002DBAC4EE|nr:MULTISPECIES: ATP-binding protein [unclassified Cocleimonas]MEB8434513.1 ATP-binding protein [Cocleimonas sp. KMM 6892]MEC4717406.1 ATP-binding protein [Cocleimonas sp. KMM 6895]MEC4746800.1 ATP-binding protein [Cocleimonas sp. KMM 6896]